MNNLKINTDFFANNGAIGRRDYFLNMVYLNILTTFFNIPFIEWLHRNINSFNDLLNIHQVVLKAPIFVLSCLMLSFALNIVIGISNTKRRLNDILGYEDVISKYLISAFLIIATISICLPIVFSISFGTLYFCISLFLLFKKGKISTQNGYELEKQFNFGAFFGTIFWGIINKIAKPLLIIILIFTPFSLHFALICGLKGNEWLIKKYKKRGEEIDTDEFNAKQKKQAISLYVILHLILPILIVGIICYLSFVFTTALINGNINIKNHQIEQLFQKAYKATVEHNFTGYQVYGNKNTFYVNDDTWIKLTFDQKIKVMELAGQISADIRNKNAANPGIKTDKFIEMNKTELRSTRTKLIVGEFKMNNKPMTDNAYEYAKALMSGYRFYTVTK